METETQKIKHSRYSPSRLEKLELCLRYSSIENQAAGQEGTDLHKAVETGDYVGLSQEQKDCVDQVRVYAENIKAGMTTGVSEQKEIKVELRDLTFGYVDLLLYQPYSPYTETHVVDYKFGRVAVVPVKDNFQMQCYCAAVLETSPTLEKVTGHIVAPRQGYVDAYTFDRSLITQVRQRIETLYERLNNPFNPPTANESTCSMCKWASICPALGQTAVAVARGIGLPLPSAFAPDAIVSSDDRGYAHVVATALENWAEQVKKNNSEFAKAGGIVTDHELRERSSGMKIPRESTHEALDRLTTTGYATAEEIAAALTLSIPQLAEAMTEVRGTTDKDEREQLRAILAELIFEGKTQYLTRVKGKGVVP